MLNVIKVKLLSERTSGVPLVIFSFAKRTLERTQSWACESSQAEHVVLSFLIPKKIITDFCIQNRKFQSTFFWKIAMYFITTKGGKRLLGNSYLILSVIRASLVTGSAFVWDGIASKNIAEDEVCGWSNYGHFRLHPTWSDSPTDSLEWVGQHLISPKLTCEVWSPVWVTNHENHQHSRHNNHYLSEMLKYSMHMWLTSKK